tara:strand:- start:29 stop:406 length:378 start_codon:yes stop_codon:yes gene_type:complete
MIIKWKIEKLIHDVSDRFIKFALLKVTATQIDLNGNAGKHSAEMFATAHFDRHNDKLISFNDLTELQVMKWAKDKINLDKIRDQSIMNVSDCEKYVVSKLHEKINPSEMEGFPWVENSIQPIQDN